VNIITFALTLHLLAIVVWVGGMFFAHMALRPVAAELLEPPQRLPLLYKVLSHFFPWVWLAVLLVLATGFWVFLGPLGGKAGLYVHLMMGIGSLMALIFFFIFFVPFKRMGAALQAHRLPLAGAQMVMIRRLIGLNLVLGLLTTAIAGLKIV